MRIPLALALSAMLAVHTLAGTPHDRSQDQLQFRAATDVVAVDFYAVDKDGRPVLGLKPEELTLTVNKQPRAIRSLEFLQVAPGADVDTPMPAAERTPVAYGSNLPGDAGRMVFLLFDHEGMAPGDEAAAKTAIPAFLDQLSPRDRVGLVTFPRGKVEVDLTTDRARLLAALRNVMGHFSDNTPTQRNCDSGEGREANDALVGILEGLTHLDGPKVVVIVSPGLAPQGFNCKWEYDNAAAAASAAQVHIYGLVPQHFGIGASSGGRIGSDGFIQASAPGSVSAGELGELIAATGGELYLLSAGAGPIFTRIARESSAYYLLSFDTTENDRNGKSHGISLTTTRPGVTIRARPSFTVESAKDAAKRAPKPSPVGPVRGLLDDLNAHRDLPLRVAAYAFRDSVKGVRLVTAVDIPGGGTLTQADFGLFDGKTKGMTEWPAPKDALGKSQAVASTTTVPGSYRLRVAASDQTGRIGAADYEFTAGLTKAGAFMLSDLMLGETAGKDFAPQLSFGSEPSATAYLELYGAMPAGGPKPSIVFEVADRMQSAAVVTVPGSIQPTREADRFIVTATLPLASLMPSDYVVRAILRGPNGELGRVVRTLHKDGR